MNIEATLEHVSSLIPNFWLRNVKEEVVQDIAVLLLSKKIKESEINLKLLKRLGTKYFPNPNLMPLTEILHLDRIEFIQIPGSVINSHNGQNSRSKWKRFGLCEHCGKIRHNKLFKRCEGCRDKLKKMRLEKQKSGLCYKCSKIPARENRTTCEECFERQKKSDEKRKKKIITTI